MTPEELDRRANDCAMEASRTRKRGDTNADVAIEAARLALSNWQPTPKPSPRVMAMREWLSSEYPHDSHQEKINLGLWDEVNEARAFLAGYAAAVKEAKPLVQRVQHSTETMTWTPHEIYQALTTYLTAIGEETL